MTSNDKGRGLSREELEREELSWLLDATFLCHLAPENLDIALAGMEWRRYSRNEVLIEEGGSARGVDLIVDGQVLVSRPGPEGDREPLARLGPGDVVGERSLFLGEHTSARVQALSPVRSLHLPPQEFAELLAVSRGLRRYIKDLVTLRDRGAALERSLLKNPFLRSLGRADLDRLTRTGRIEPKEVGARLVSAGQRSRDVFVVLTGRVAVYAPRDASGSRALLATKGPGWLFGEVAALLDTPRTADVEALEPTEVLRVQARSFMEILSRNPPLQRRLYQRIAAMDLPEGVPAGATARATIVAVQGGAHALGSTTLAYGLAAALRGAGGAVLVDLEGPATARRLRLGTSAERVKDIEVQRLDASPGGRLEVLWPAEPARVQDLLSALAESQPPEGHVVVSCGASATGARRAVDRAESVVLVQRAADRSHGHAERRRQLHVDAIRLDGTPLPLDAGSISVRVPDDPATARSFWAGAGPDILADERCPLGRACRRLARALHGRTVGLALGGGGALGYAHVGLLRVLHKAGIPVDYVSGSSFGALAAGIYAAGGLDSLEELVRRRVRVLAAAIAGVADTAAFTRLADSIAGGLQMSETEIPFYPVGIDVLSGAEVVPARGSVGHGVRCSSGLPGVYAATPYGNTWLVDGGICNNVPASVVWEARASFIIASNPIPTIAAATPPTSSRSLARALKSHTLGRVDHLVRSLYLLMSQAGRDRAALADYVFNLDLQGHDPHAFQAGMEIARAGEEQAEAQIAAIAQAYEAVRGPRP